MEIVEGGFSLGEQQLTAMVSLLLLLLRLRLYLLAMLMFRIVERRRERWTRSLALILVKL